VLSAFAAAINLSTGPSGRYTGPKKKKIKLTDESLILPKNSDDRYMVQGRVQGLNNIVQSSALDVAGKDVFIGSGVQDTRVCYARSPFTHAHKDMHTNSRPHNAGGPK